MKKDPIWARIISALTKRECFYVTDTEITLEEEYVLIRMGEEVAEGWWSSQYKSKWRCSRTPGTPTAIPVTHWRPLPTPPAALSSQTGVQG